MMLNTEQEYQDKLKGNTTKKDNYDFTIIGMHRQGATPLEISVHVPESIEYINKVIKRYFK